MTSVLSPRRCALVSDARLLLGDQSVIGTWIRNRSRSHGEHHTLALEVGEPSLICENVPTYILADVQIHTYNQELFSRDITPTNTLYVTDTHITQSRSIIVTVIQASDQESESLIASVRHCMCVCVFKFRGVSQTVSDIISISDIILFPKIAEL